MGVAALVLGIISIIIGFIPLVGMVAYIPAIIGLVLGIVEVVKKSKSDEKKGMGIAGIVLTALAILIIWVYNVIIIAGVSSALQDVDVNEWIDSIDWNVTYDD